MAITGDNHSDPCQNVVSWAQLNDMEPGGKYFNKCFKYLQYSETVHNLKTGLPWKKMGVWADQYA